LVASGIELIEQLYSNVIHIMPSMRSDWKSAGDQVCSFSHEFLLSESLELVNRSSSCVVPNTQSMSVNTKLNLGYVLISPVVITMIQFAVHYLVVNQIFLLGSLVPPKIAPTAMLLVRERTNVN